MDGGARVNVMSDHTKKVMGIKIVKPAPFRVQMAGQQAVQPLGLVENVELRIEGAQFATSFLILDVGTSYLMLGSHYHGIQIQTHGHPHRFQKMSLWMPN